MAMSGDNHRRICSVPASLTIELKKDGIRFFFMQNHLTACGTTGHSFS